MGLRCLDFPAEIREQVYHEVLTTANSRCLSKDDVEPDHYKYHLDLLLVNKQVHKEAKKIFQDNIFVKITTPWPEAIQYIRSEGKVPTVAISDKAAVFRDFHLWVFIDTPATQFMHYPGSFSMLICLEDLEAFTRMWHFSNLNHSGLNRYLRGKRSIILFRRGITGDESEDISDDDGQNWFLDQIWSLDFLGRKSMGKIFYRMSDIFNRFLPLLVEIGGHQLRIPCIGTIPTPVGDSNRHWH